MTPLRALLVPFHFTSLVLITILALLLAAAIHFDTSEFLWLGPAFIITSWVFKYAFAMLEHIADGESYAPTLQAQPGFTFKSESELLPAVHALQEAGGNKPALQLVENFVNAFPAQVTTGITALRQRLEDLARN